MKNGPPDIEADSAYDPVPMAIGRQQEDIAGDKGSAAVREESVKKRSSPDVEFGDHGGRHSNEDNGRPSHRQRIVGDTWTPE